MEREPQARTRVDGGLPGRAPLVAAEPHGDRGRSARGLLLAWGLYWAALLAWQLWPLARGWWRIRQAGGRGTLSLSWSGDFVTAALWIAVPPLLMVLAWLLLTARRRAPARRSAPPPP